MSLIHNEQTKLLANALDRASTACLTVGIATPAAGYLYGVNQALGTAFLIAALYTWLFAAIGLHLLARHVIEGLQE
jgi:hypothetical protein